MEYRILGPLEVVAEGRVLSLGGAKLRALLAILLLHANEIVSTDRLIDDLWAGEPPATAESALQVYVSQLRKMLQSAGREGSEVLVTQRPGYLLRVGGDELDLDTFRRLADEGREALTNEEPAAASERLREALALWRGQPLMDFAFDPFAEREIERLTELRLTATEDRIEADLALGHDKEVVGELEFLVGEYPFRERLRQHLMLALYRCSRQADALAAYHETADVLSEQLGIDPSPALQLLHERILRQDPTLAAPRRRLVSLPTPPNPLIGREEEVKSVSRQLRNGVRVITLTGAGGVGKTRVAIETAERLEDAFPDGITFIDLAPVRDPELVAFTVSAALRLNESGLSEPEKALAAFLRDRSTLLVLDNFEHLIGSASFVGRLMAATAAPSLLITSRTPLHVSGEHEFPIHPLPTPPQSVDESMSMADNEAVQLFEQRAIAAHPSFAITAANFHDVAEICRRLDGLPLAIELAAARVKLLPPKTILERLEHRLTLLADGPRDVSDRQRSLVATVDWSYRLLEDAERQLLASVSVFAGGWDLEAAIEVCGLREAEGQALDLLASLLDSSLIFRSRAREDSRFLFLETIREFASDRLEVSGQAERLRRRHANYFRRLAEDSDRRFREGSEVTWGGRIGLDLDNFQAALNWALGSGEAETAAIIAGALAQFWSDRGEGPVADALFRRAAALRDADDPRRAWDLAGLGWIFMASDRNEDMSRAFEEAHRIASLARDERCEAHASLGRTYAALFVDPKDGAEGMVELVDRLVPRLQAWGDERGLAIAYISRSQARWNACRFAPVRDDTARAISHARAAGSGTLERIALQTRALAGVFGSTSVDEVRIDTDELERRAEVFPSLRSLVLEVRSEIAVLLGHLDEARSLRDSFVAAHREFQGIEPPGVFELSWRIESCAGEAAAAEAWISRGYEFYHSLGDLSYASTHAVYWAMSCYELGRFDEARRLAEECRKTTASHDVLNQFLWRAVEAKLLAREERFREAAATIRDASAWVQRTDALAQYVSVFSDQAEVNALAGRPDAAREALTRALDAAERKGATVLIERVQEHLAQLDRRSPT